MKKKEGLKKVLVLSMAVSLMLGSVVGCGKKVEETNEKIPEVNYVGSATSNTLTLYPDGSLMEVACEDYSDANFLYQDLQNYIDTEINSYNQKEGVSKISLLQYQDAFGLIKTAIKYSDFDTYVSFNNMEMKLTAYDVNQADEIAKEEAEKRLQISSSTDTTSNVKHEISAEELAEAGYSLEQIQAAEEGSAAAELSEGISVEDTVATFTDVDTQKVVKSSEISTDGNMMLIVDEKMDIRLESGKILYTNEHASVEGGVATTDGSGTAIIVFYVTY